MKWISERSESFLSDTHARDQSNCVQLALDSHGRFLALRVTSIANLGAHLSTYGAYVPTEAGAGMLTGLYDLPAVDYRVKAVFTNTAPVDAYRGAGKPETNFLLERVIDCAARELNLSPLEIRRRNLVAKAAMPYTTALGHTFDSGHFSDNLNKAMLYFEQVCERRKIKTGHRGVGLSAYFENTAGYQEEQARIHVSSDGQFSVFIGTQSNGQGHETAFAQLLSQTLEIPISLVRVRQGDTQSVSHGHGTGGSRSLIMGGEAVLHAAAKVRDKAHRVAAHLLEAAEQDIILNSDGFQVAGTDKTVSWQNICKVCYQPMRLPDNEEPGLEALGFAKPKAGSYPNGIHVCEVFVDTQTGVVQLGEYVIVDDFGHVVNPAIVTGQVHGGTAQGIGQALLEEATYETDSGQLLSGTFMDYALPKADDLPNFSTAFNATRCVTNELGSKGCGEAGAIAAPAAVINAIVDALSPLGVRHIAMPATPERIWRAIRNVQSSV